MVFNATFNNNTAISWWSVFLVEETGVPGEKHWPVASHWQTLYRVHIASAGFELTTLVVIGLYEFEVIQLPNSLSHPGPLPVLKLNCCSIDQYI